MRGGAAVARQVGERAVAHRLGDGERRPLDGDEAGPVAGIDDRASKPAERRASWLAATARSAAFAMTTKASAPVR